MRKKSNEQKLLGELIYQPQESTKNFLKEAKKRNLELKALLRKKKNVIILFLKEIVEKIIVENNFQKEISQHILERVREILKIIFKPEEIKVFEEKCVKMGNFTNNSNSGVNSF